MGKRTRTTLSIDANVLEKAHATGINVSRFLENSLKAYLEGGSQQPQPETTPQPEQPNQTPKEPDLESVFPEECMRKLRQLGFDVTDNSLLKQIVQDCLRKVIVDLELYDPIELRYPTTNTREYA